MTTSLAAQLKKLATPESQSLLSGKDLVQASFLFESKEAATYERQHFYNIGINGLQQLIQRDERFREFEQNLYSPSSQTLQRFVQTSETNKLLDEAISKFLLLLSPYMQLREAHKAMEWMVHRYNIHLRNVDALMMCVLPYHDQQPFIMSLRLLQLDSNDCAKWRWLEPVKKGNVFLARQTLITHCRAAKGFLGFICDMLTKHIEANTDESGTPSARHLQRIISFYTQTVLGVLMGGPPTESILSTLIPAITAGLKSHDLPDHMVSSYMILSQLLVQINLNSSLLKSFLNVIAKNAQPSLLSSALMVIVIMFQKQEISRVSKKSFRYLSRHSSLPQLLAGIAKEANAEPFLTPFMAVLVERALADRSSSSATSDSNPDDGDDDSVPPLLMSLLMDILNLLPLEQSTVAVVARAVLNWFKNREGDAMEVDDETTVQAEAFKVFRLLENRFSNILDTAVSEQTSADVSGQMANIVKQLFELSVATSQHDLTSDPMSCLAVCLHHRHGVVRRTAVEKLLQDVALMGDTQSVQSALVMRLQDEDSTVVRAVLENPQKLWQMFEDKSLLYQTLLKKLATFRGRQGKNEARDQILKALCFVPADVAPEMEVTVIVLSFLVVLDESEFPLVETLLGSPITTWNRLLAVIVTDWLPVVATQRSQEGNINEKQLAALCLRLAETLTSHLLVSVETSHDTIAMLYKNLRVTPRHGSVLLVLLLVTESLMKQSQTADVKIQLQKQLVFMLSHLSFNKHMLHLGKEAGKVESPGKAKRSQEVKTVGYLSQLAKNGTLPKEVIVDLLGHLQLVSMPERLREAKFWDQADLASLEQNWLGLMTMTVNFLLDLSSKKNSVMSSIGKGLFETVFKVLEEATFVARFLCLLWTASEDPGVTVPQRAHVLQFSQVYFTSLSDSQILAVVSPPTPVWPCLLILLSNKHERVRDVAFTLLASLARNTTSVDTSPFLWFADNVLKYRQEVTKDRDFLPQVLKNILEEEPDLGASPQKKRRMRSSRPPPHSASMHYLLDMICSPLTSTCIRTGLLSVLCRLDTPESFLPLMSLLKQILTGITNEADLGATPATTVVKSCGLSSGEREVVAWLLKRFTPAVAGCVDTDTDALQSLLAAISCSHVGGDNGETIQMLAVTKLKRKFMAALPYMSRQFVLARLLDVLCSSSDTELGRRCRKVIKHMAMESSLITDELRSVLTKTSVATVREAKRLKHRPTTELESLPWKRVVSLLEMVQSKSKVSDAALIVPVAFQVLARVLEMEHKGSGEYIKQLLLGTLNYICSRHQRVDDAVKGEHLNTDLIVQCIRSSDNPHTHHQALLLLSTAAKISPDLLLHNMMSVFTFMGANILRQDDAYSFHVIDRILENVIPALVMACEEKSRDKPTTRQRSSTPNASPAKPVQSENMMTAVLHVFVDAIPYIPAHRKIMLFDKLLQVVGADKYLWRLILLLLESVTVRSSKQSNGQQGESVLEDEKSSGPVTTSDLEFLTSLCEKFSASQLLQSFHQALTYLLQLPEEKQVVDQTLPANKGTLNLVDVMSDAEIFSVTYHTAKQLRHFKFALVFVLNRLLSSQHLVAQLAEAEPSSFLSDFQHLMETVLQFIGQVTQSHDRHREEISNRFWRILLNKSHDLLDHLVSLLPDSMIMDVVRGLMDHSLPLVQRRAVELLNGKLLHYKEGLSSQEVDMLLSVTTKLKSIVQQCLVSSDRAEVSDDDLITGQTALYSLKILCRILGEKNHKQFIQVLRVCVKVLSCYHDNAAVSASAMLCAAEIVSSVKVHSLEHLAKFMPLVTSHLQSEDITRHEVLLLAGVTSLQKIIESVPLFLSPYLLEIIVQICNISSIIGTQADSHRPVVSQKVKLICTTLAMVTPTRTFLPVLEKSFMALQERMASCADCAMSILKDHIVKMSREDLTTFSQDLLKFFFTCLDIRATNDKMSEADLDVIEGRVIEAFVCLVFKLSEAQFKPMLLQIYSWATDEDVSRDRVLVFYRICDSLAAKLKNLFTLFAGHIIKHSAEVLDVNNKSKNKCKYFGKGKNARRKSCRLLCYIIDCLQKTFSYDTEGFLTKERFDVVMQALVDQLENQLGKDAVSDERVNNHVVPCLASLAAAAHDDSLWKDLNYQILLKTRHESPKVRTWALSAVDALHKQLGEDYTQLVPETIPFMAELMEDESDEVEKYTQKVLAAMEVSVGENLQEYF